MKLREIYELAKRWEGTCCTGAEEIEGFPPPVGI